ncbi:MAG TPA: hypothetical protein PLG59_07355 [bacterium]|nr:hypothetical protein [bacterium]
MKESSDSRQSIVWEKILSLPAKELASQVRRAAVECQSALSMLTGRKEIPADVLNSLQQEVSGMLERIGLIIGRLHFTDTQAKDLSDTPTMQRYLNILKILQGGRGNLSPFEKHALETERDAIAENAFGEIAKLGSLLQAGLLLRLEVIQHWKALLYKAVETYSKFKDVLRNSLHAIKNQVTNSTVGKILIAVLSHEDTFPSRLFNARKRELPSDLGDMDRHAVQELEELCAVESQLQVVRGEVVKLEHTDSRIRYEIRRTGAKDAAKVQAVLSGQTAASEEGASQQSEGEADSRAPSILKRADD